MKKMPLVILAVLLVLCLAGCSWGNAQADVPPAQPSTAPTEATVPETEPETVPPAPPIVLENAKFPAGTTIYGVDVSGMDESAAFAAINASVKAYVLKLTINDKTISLPAEALELKASARQFHVYFNALINQKEAQVPALLTYSKDNLRRQISIAFNEGAQNAEVAYNEITQGFEIYPEVIGSALVSGPAVEAADAAILRLETTARATAEVQEVLPNILMDDPRLAGAQKAANSYLNINLRYTFTPDGGVTKTETVTKDAIAAFLTIGSDYTVKVSQNAVEKYASRMNDKYHVPGEAGKFVTTGGATIDIEVDYAGQLVDVDALKEDLYSCISNKVSGTRVAAYKDKTQVEDMSFGGNYVEVNMSTQHLWVYKNGECVVDTPVVTGCAAAGNSTPRGVYTINNKARNVKLIGADYESFVQYWIPFIGHSYGLHDASWRRNFGGDIYLYNGSHGCVNMPRSITKDIYDNVEIGTKVVLYGGATWAEPLEQTFTGSAEASTAWDEPFQLDVVAEFDVDDITYTAADPTILTVDDEGYVTPLMEGTTTITVFSTKQRFYTEASFTVTVTVVSPCTRGRHTAAVWTTVKEPTCGRSGLETAVCDLCGAEAQREIPATGKHGTTQITIKPATCTTPAETVVVCRECSMEVSRTEGTEALGHAFAEEAEFCINGCGEKNPDYQPPETPTELQPTGPIATDPPGPTETEPASEETTA